MTQKQKTTFIYAAPVVLLCIPLIGNFTSKEFNWSVGDFGIAAVLLFGTAFLIDLIQRIIKNRTYKILVSVAILLLLLLTWAELAVGIFGTPFAGN
jgi:dipeptide/tripeptide permease